MLTKTHEEAHIIVQNFAKFYPNGKIKLFSYSKPFYKRKEGYEPHEPPKGFTTTTSAAVEASTRGSSAERSLRRTKTLISDIVLCTEFDMFATFTFKKDRQDILKCKRKMSDWLKDQQKQWGKFEYLIVAEFHKDGKSLHFHALLKNYKGQLTKTNKKINNRTAYNIKSYQKGFSTVIKIDNVEKVASYIKKYITKDMPSTGLNKKKFWNSKNLKRPLIEYNINPQLYQLTEVYQKEFWSISENMIQSESQHN